MVWIRDDDEMLRLFRKLDARVLDVDTAEFSDEHDPNTFDQRRAVNDPELSAGIPSDSDSANLGRRSRFVTIPIWFGRTANSNESSSP